MIPDMVIKIKLWYENNKNDLVIAVIIFLVGMAGFGLGRLSFLWIPKEPITIDSGDMENEVLKEAGQGQESGGRANITSALKSEFVGSKNGTSYHFPWCPGAQKIKEENKIWFETKKEAEDRGYKPAGNCPGL
ncbi:MAG: hypothetical protein Q8R29_01925 [bacterium]|nr:hypothetical protein [bacterium]